MFTIYIHILEVLAMHPQGARTKLIVEMGAELVGNERRVKSYLRDLMTQGFVNSQDKDDLWFITDKAIEYCETVVRKYDASHAVNIVRGHDYSIVGGYVFSIDADGIPDHVYIGLASDDGSGPLDEIVSESVEKTAPEQPNDAITDDFDHPPVTNHASAEKECLWCHKMFTGQFVFCDRCMDDSESFQDRWNIASQIEGTALSDNFRNGYGEHNNAYDPKFGYWNEYGEFCYFDEE